MNPVIIAILYSISGFLMKFSDDEYDEKSNKKIAIFIGIICGISIAYLTTNNTDAVYIFFGILIGNGLSLKIDGIHHIATLCTFAVIVIFSGIPSLNIATLLICIITAFIDEIGNDNERIYKRSEFLRFFFEYRFTMKIAISLLAILGYLQTYMGFQIAIIDFLSFQTFICFILFELSYELAGSIFKRFNQK